MARATGGTYARVSGGTDRFGFRFLWQLAADGQVTAGAALVHADLGRDALLQLGDMGDDADHPASRPQAVENGHRLVQGLLVQAAEALVDEQRLDPGPARPRGDNARQAEGHRP